MRKIGLPEISVFMIIFCAAICLGIASSYLLCRRAPLADFRALAIVLSAVIFTYCWALVFFRIFLTITPLKEGWIAQRSSQEFVYHLFLMFLLLLFHPIIRSSFLPLPIMRLFYQALGLDFGKNSYTAGIIADPMFVHIGQNTLLGQYSLVIAHVIENERLGHFPVHIGSNVTIGAHSTVMAGVSIGDGAIVAVGAVVTKGTRIGPGEHWGGVPAKLKIGRAHV